MMYLLTNYCHYSYLNGFDIFTKAKNALYSAFGTTVYTITVTKPSEFSYMFNFTSDFIHLALPDIVFLLEFFRTTP
jgi:hypothetical protein